MNSLVTLREHQIDAVQDVDSYLDQGYDCGVCILPTGAGKTILQAFFAQRAYQKGEPLFLIAHRDVLLGQLSDALCLFQIPHSFLCSDKTRREITDLNHAKYGNHFYNETSKTVVVSVATFAARLRKNKIPTAMLQAVKWWLLDEGHHLVQGTQWAMVIEALENAKGLGFTATPIRGDRKGLGEHAHGYYQFMSQTVSMIDLVKRNMLTRMKVYVPDMLDLGGLKVNRSGDFNPDEAYKKAREQLKHIHGSAVEYYNQTIHGQPAITFAFNIEHGIEIAKRFNEAGIPSKFVSSKSSELERKTAVRDLRSGKLWNLVNVDLFGEGFDAPCVAGVFLLRKTESYSLFKQQIGRAVRTAEGKEFGYIFDHVGNVDRMMDKYNLLTPYHDPLWTLDAQGKGKDAEDDEDDELIAEPRMICPECLYDGVVHDVYDGGELFEPGFTQEDGSFKCPDCDHVFSKQETETQVRKVQEKRGQLVEKSFDDIADILSKRDEEILKPIEEKEFNGYHAMANAKRYLARQNAIIKLQEQINKWCNEKYQETKYAPDIIKREFEIRFKVDIYSAQVLSAPKAEQLLKEVKDDLNSRSHSSHHSK